MFKAIVPDAIKAHNGDLTKPKVCEKAFQG